ncbi:hypothetical protein D3C85_1868420 [compost metagenome]
MQLPVVHVGNRSATRAADPAYNAAGSTCNDVQYHFRDLITRFARQARNREFYLVSHQVGG